MDRHLCVEPLLGVSVELVFQGDLDRNLFGNFILGFSEHDLAKPAVAEVAPKHVFIPDRRAHCQLGGLPWDWGNNLVEQATQMFVRQIKLKRGRVLQSSTIMDPSTLPVHRRLS